MIPLDTNDDFYPDVRQLQHGDVLFPRRLDVKAIATFSDQVTEWGDNLAKSLAAPAPSGCVKPKKGAPVDLIKYWPCLLEYIKLVRDNKLSLTEALTHIAADLPPGSLNPSDLSQAIIAKQYVGHCAIVDRPDPSDEPWIVESSHAHGRVHCMPYEAWRSEREQQEAAVWVYRLKSLNGSGPEVHELRHQFVNAAHQLRMQNTRYAIFDNKVDGSKMCLDPRLNRAVGEAPYLYCSELVWVCAKTCGITITVPEGAVSSSTHFNMFTPKDLTGCTDQVQPEFLAPRHSPGPYSVKLKDKILTADK